MTQEGFLFVRVGFVCRYTGTCGGQLILEHNTVARKVAAGTRKVAAGTSAPMTRQGDGFLAFGFYVALRPRRRDDLLGTGTEWERGQGDWLDRGNRPKKTGETVDRRQNNGSVKAVPPRHCPATCALRNCSFNCCAGQSH